VNGSLRQRSRAWTPDEDDLLRSLALQGLSEGEISEQVGRNKSSIRSRAMNIKVAIERDWNGIQKLNKRVT
jgi:DNA-directed RNA polymerase specialized sigma24 family protein